MLETPKVHAWVQKVKDLCQPDDIVVCSGSPEEYDQMWELLIEAGTAKRLNSLKRPNSYIVRSDPDDVARVESRTFICSREEQDAGPNNNWMPPKDMKDKLTKLFRGCMRGRTMYVIPFSMGPIDSTLSHLGVQITDSPYVVASMHIMTRIGHTGLDTIGSDEFVPCLHSVGKPLSQGEADTSWPCNPDQLHIAHFPEERQIYSFGSGYGGMHYLEKNVSLLELHLRWHAMAVG